jgi:peptidyl-prolyl cis-trans isomerase SurA
MIKKIFAALVLALAGAQMAPAQSNNPYSAAIVVNDSIISRFELDQRMLMIQSFGTAGDLRDLATTQLIEDRLRMEAAKALGITLTEEELQGGMEEFAARGNLSTDQLIAFIGQRGIAPQTFRDFIRAGFLWRNVVRSKFGSKVFVTDDEVDTALNLAAGTIRESILFAEIVLPVEERGDAPTLALAKRLSDSISSIGGFAAAARQYSRSPSAARGGQLDWVPIANLPPQIVGKILALEPGEVTAPITMGTNVGLFQFRDIRVDDQPEETVISATYALVPIPAGRSPEAQMAEARKLMGLVDTCADLRAESESFGPDAYTEASLPISEVPQDIAFEIAKLDQNETTTTQVQNAQLGVLMLCNRATELAEGARDQIRQAMFNQRVGSFGDGYLQELKGDAVIAIK